MLRYAMLPCVQYCVRYAMLCYPVYSHLVSFSRCLGQRVIDGRSAVYLCTCVCIVVFGSKRCQTDDHVPSEVLYFCLQALLIQSRVKLNNDSRNSFLINSKERLLWPQPLFHKTVLGNGEFGQMYFC